MPLTLIGAYQCGDDDRPLALLPLAGMPLAEHQARRAAAAGAAPIYLLVEAVTPEFAGIVGRLQADGIAAELSETIASAAGTKKVLLIADGCLPEPGLLAAVLAHPAPNVATITDGPGRTRYERIDARARWAGAALLTPAIVSEAMPDGWDPVSTLLRRAEEEGAGRVDAGAPPLMAERSEDLVDTERGLIAASRIGHDDWIARGLFTTIEDHALPWLLRREIEPTLLASGAAVLSVLAGLAALLLGLRWPALIALLLVGPAATAADRLAGVQSRPISSARFVGIARRGGGALALLGLGVSLTSETGQWGWLLVAGVVIAALSGLAVERPMPPPRWYATASTLAWVMLPFAAVGRWGLGLAALALHASLSFAAALVARRDAQRDSSGG